MGYFRVMENLLVREAHLNDLTVLEQFEQEIIKAERSFDPTIRPDPISYYSLRQLILDAGAFVVVAELNSEIVASGSARIKKARHYLDHKDYALLGFMYTKPNARGRGINKRVVEKLLAWAAGRQLYEVRLTVYHDNENAIKAYEKSGFKSHLNEMRLRLDSTTF